MESQQEIDVSLGEPCALLRELEEVCWESYDAGLARPLGLGRRGRIGR
ncbi:hypothetical protein ABZ297_12490 [Nonomuraea sp. NPDC005983]